MLVYRTKTPIGDQVLADLGENGARLYAVTQDEKSSEITYSFIPFRTTEARFKYRSAATAVELDQIPTGTMLEHGWSIAATLLWQDTVYVYWISPPLA